MTFTINDKYNDAEKAHAFAIKLGKNFWIYEKKQIFRSEEYIYIDIISIRPDKSFSARPIFIKFDEDCIRVKYTRNLYIYECPNDRDNTWVNEGTISTEAPSKIKRLLIMGLFIMKENGFARIEN